ncbi:MAG: tetratricopeptide repeat protein [Bryobacteraceae bacterium]|jgi:tetratricopeptide (TPR) repeat protein
MTDRLEALRNILAQDPDNRLARYGLAMEYVKAGRLEQALDEYRALVSSHPDYAYAYFHAGQALERLGRLEDARQMYTRGVEAAIRGGDAHARSELQAALDLLG